MAHRFEDVLDECVEQLLGGESVERCLELYPGQATQLEPLLRVAMAVSQASSAAGPRSEFKAETKYKVRPLLHAVEHKAKPNRV